ncbi:MAG: hypothetical protein U0670_02945 [Anaerolineae bacterium]
MEQSLTILYTGELRGNLESLPYLFTYLKMLRQRMISDRTFYVDIGGACDPSVWHCEVTNGRSMLVALDGMGCAVVNVSGYPTAAVRDQLGDNVALTLVDDRHPHVSDDLIFLSDQPTSTIEYDRLAIVLAPGDRTRLQDRVIKFTPVTGKQVGIVNLEFLDGEWMLANYTIRDLPANTPADPTIAGAVDFIVQEAQQAQKKRGR